MNKHIGILTAGGDCPGLNAAIRGIGKSAIRSNRMEPHMKKDRDALQIEQNRAIRWMCGIGPYKHVTELFAGCVESGPINTSVSPSWRRT